MRPLFILLITLYLLAAIYVAMTLQVMTYTAPLLGKADPFRGQPASSRRIVALLAGVLWPITALYMLTNWRVDTSSAMPDSRSASRVLKRTVARRECTRAGDH